MRNEVRSMKMEPSLWGRLHVAAAQIHSGGTVEENLDRLECQARQAALAGAEVILFAEGAMQGYDYDMTQDRVAAAAVTLESAPVGRVVALAEHLKMAILVGFLEQDADRFFNSVLIAWPDGRRQVARKHVLTAGELGAGLRQGDRDRTVIEINGVRIAIIICADGGIEDLDSMLKEKRVDYRFCPTGGGGKMTDMLHEDDLLTPEGRRRYKENRLRVFNTEAIVEGDSCCIKGFASANALGPVGVQTCHQGHCMIVDANGVMRAQIPGTIMLEHQHDQMIHAVLNFRRNRRNG